MSFVKRNLVAIVMIPSIVLMHYGWQKLQLMEDLVPAHERKDVNPAIEVSESLFRVLYKRVYERRFL